MAERPSLRAAWNLRALGLLLLGPVSGITLVATTFRVSTTLLGLAGAVFLFSLSMFGVLVKAERRRLAAIAAPASRPGGRP